MLNVVAIMGRLTANPELKHTQNDISVVTFNIACDRNFARQGEQRQADFITITAWRQTAEFICKYFGKGDMIAIDGSLQTRQYEDKQGNKRTATEVVANNASFCGSKGSDNQQPKQAHSEAQTTYSAGSNDDFAVIDDTEDLPFR